MKDTAARAWQDGWRRGRWTRCSEARDKINELRS
jgi:hypothetical protein